MTDMLRTLSLGAGVQSSTLALMASTGEMDSVPDMALFADTGWEPQAVYEHLDWLETQLAFPVYRVSAGNIRDDLLKGVNTTGQQNIGIPVHLDDGGLARRQCSREYKLEPMTQFIRKFMGYQPGQRVTQRVERWVGISTDESWRMKDAREKWVDTRWPLIEMNMSRADCQTWFEDRYPERQLPRSACLGCPYHSDAEWAAIQRNDPEGWADVVFVDSQLREEPLRSIKKKGVMFLHRSCKPLGKVPLSGGADQMGLWDEECEGICGV